LKFTANHNKKPKMKSKLILATVLTSLIACFTVFAVTVTSPVHLGSGSSTCIGSFTGTAVVTNSATGTVWFTPPSGTTNAIVTDVTGFSSPYVSMVKVIRNDSASWCGTNSVSFPASSAKQYKFLIYIKNTPPPPSNGDILTLSIQWQ
jgi:hypothetical protein